jgi:hypothetical protein
MMAILAIPLVLNLPQVVCWKLPGSVAQKRPRPINGAFLTLR